MQRLNPYAASGSSVHDGEPAVAIGISREPHVF
jgi:hypothetical protein